MTMFLYIMKRWLTATVYPPEGARIAGYLWHGEQKWAVLRPLQVTNAEWQTLLDGFKEFL